MNPSTFITLPALHHDSGAHKTSACFPLQCEIGSQPRKETPWQRNDPTARGNEKSHSFSCSAETSAPGNEEMHFPAGVSSEQPGAFGFFRGEKILEWVQLETF